MLRYRRFELYSHDWVATVVWLASTDSETHAWPLRKMNLEINGLQHFSLRTPNDDDHNFLEHVVTFASMDIIH